MLSLNHLNNKNMTTKKEITKIVDNYDFGDFISLDDIVRLTANHFEELGFQFYWVDDNGLWAIAFNNKSKAINYGAIVFDFDVKFREGNYDEKRDETIELLLDYSQRSEYYNKLKVEQKKKKKQITIKDNQVLADYMIRRFVDVIVDYKDIEFNQKSALIARVQNLKIK